MYWFFVILSLLLLAFNLEWIQGRPWHDHYVLIWKLNGFLLMRISPSQAFVLVDGSSVYRYLDSSSAEHKKDTYIPTIEINTGLVRHHLHYQYLLDWIKEPPIVKGYPTDVRDEIDILNHVSKSLQP